VSMVGKYLDRFGWQDGLSWMTEESIFSAIG